jgi:cell division protease FtsH
MGLPVEDKYLTTRQEFLDNIASLLGGRVAEQLVYNESTTGASNDLDRATDLARSMVTEYGMSEKLGPLKIGNRHGNPFLGRDAYEDRNYSEEVANTVDKEVRAIIDECYEVARQLLNDNREKMDEIAKVLLEKESIEREEFLLLMNGAKVPANRTPRENPPAEPPPSSTPDTTADEPETPARPVLRPRLEPGMA